MPQTPETSRKSRSEPVQKKNKVPRRRQSLRVHKQKRHARERMDDVPCPLPDELFGGCKLCSQPSAFSLSEKQHHRQDISEGIRGNHEQEQNELEQQSANNKQQDSCCSASTQSIQSSTSSAIQYSGSSHDINCIRREFQIALMKRRVNPSIHRNGVISNPELVCVNSDENESDMDSSYVSFSLSMQSDDGLDCCSHVWDALVKLTALLIRLGNFAAEHEMLAYPLAAIAFYICLGLVQPMIASIIAALTGWIWPPLHFFLASTAGFVWRVADWLHSMDQLGRNMICDMAANYCRHYRLLCDHQCSFVDRALDGVKTSRTCFG